MLKRHLTFAFCTIFISMSFGCAQLTAANIPFVKGFNLTEDGDQLLEVGNSTMISRAQKAVLEAKRLGANHIIINPRAAMLGPYSNKIIPIFPMKESLLSMSRKMVTFIKWTREQNLTVQIRPILFVVKELQGLTPYTSEENGKTINWWHGNIQPSDPLAWFKSLKEYHDIYLNIASEANIEFYTIGAELYSMSVGIQGEWPQYPVGFAKEWNHFLSYARTKLPSHTLIMYDVTYTDATVTESSGLTTTGGEFARWHSRLMSSEHNHDWFELKKFWESVDLIGIDMYRSLAAENDRLPKDYNQLVKTLQTRTDRYANEVSSALMEIELTLDIEKTVMFKEVGFRSSENALVNPFVYDNPNEKINLDNQAAAYQAFINSFFVNQQDWLKGVAFWDISIGGKRQGEKDAGFTPLGKKKSEAIIIDFFDRKFQ